MRLDNEPLTTENTDVLRENVLSGTNDGHWVSVKVGLATGRIGALVGQMELFKLAENVADFQALLEIL